MCFKRRVKGPRLNASHNLDLYWENTVKFRTEEIAWGTYGWPVPSADDFTIDMYHVNENDKDRYLVMKTTHSVWFVEWTDIDVYHIPAHANFPNFKECNIGNQQFMSYISEFCARSGQPTWQIADTKCNVYLIDRYWGVAPEFKADYFMEYRG